MEITKFDVEGPLFIRLKMIGDLENFFVERFRKDLFSELGLPEFIQDNHSRSAFGILRGLHFQYAKPQGKLVSVTRGSVFDVAVDVRVGSPTLGKHVSVELRADQPSWFWIPAGFAHGFQVLSAEGADMLYKLDAQYNPEGQAGIAWDDSTVAVPWPLSNPSISERDKKMSSWEDYLRAPKLKLSELSS